jgi:hypothetical protein
LATATAKWTFCFPHKGDAGRELVLSGAPRRKC